MCQHCRLIQNKSFVNDYHRIFVNVALLAENLPLGLIDIPDYDLSRVTPLLTDPKSKNFHYIENAHTALRNNYVVDCNAIIDFARPLQFPTHAFTHTDNYNRYVPVTAFGLCEYFTRYVLRFDHDSYILNPYSDSDTLRKVFLALPEMFVTQHCGVAKPYPAFVTENCGYCAECLADKMCSITNRAIIQSMTTQVALFSTLSYATPRIPRLANFDKEYYRSNRDAQRAMLRDNATLHYPDVSQMFNRVRSAVKRLPDTSAFRGLNITPLYCGEYGKHKEFGADNETARPHYHTLLFIEGLSNVPTDAPLTNFVERKVPNYYAPYLPTDRFGELGIYHQNLQHSYRAQMLVNQFAVFGRQMLTQSANKNDIDYKYLYNDNSLQYFIFREWQCPFILRINNKREKSGSSKTAYYVTSSLFAALLENGYIADSLNLIPAFRASGHKELKWYLYREYFPNFDPSALLKRVDYKTIVRGKNKGVKRPIKFRIPVLRPVELPPHNGLSAFPVADTSSYLEPNPFYMGLNTCHEYASNVQASAAYLSEYGLKTENMRPYNCVFRSDYVRYYRSALDNIPYKPKWFAPKPSQIVERYCPTSHPLYIASNDRDYQEYGINYTPASIDSYIPQLSNGYQDCYFIPEDCPYNFEREKEYVDSLYYNPRFVGDLRKETKKLVAPAIKLPSICLGSNALSNTAFMDFVAKSAGKCIPVNVCRGVDSAPVRNNSHQLISIPPQIKNKLKEKVSNELVSLEYVREFMHYLTLGYECMTSSVLNDINAVLPRMFKKTAYNAPQYKRLLDVLSDWYFKMALSKTPKVNTALFPLMSLPYDSMADFLRFHFRSLKVRCPKQLIKGSKSLRTMELLSEDSFNALKTALKSSALANDIPSASAYLPKYKENTAREFIKENKTYIDSLFARFEFYSDPANVYTDPRGVTRRLHNPLRAPKRNAFIDALLINLYCYTHKISYPLIKVKSNDMRINMTSYLYTANRNKYATLQMFNQQKTNAESSFMPISKDNALSYAIDTLTDYEMHKKDYYSVFPTESDFAHYAVVENDVHKLYDSIPQLVYNHDPYVRLYRYIFTALRKYYTPELNRTNFTILSKQKDIHDYTYHRNLMFMRWDYQDKMFRRMFNPDYTAPTSKQQQTAKKFERMNRTLRSSFDYRPEMSLF